MMWKEVDKSHNFVRRKNAECKMPRIPMVRRITKVFPPYPGLNFRQTSFNCREGHLPFLRPFTLKKTWNCNCFSDSWRCKSFLPLRNVFLKDLGAMSGRQHLLPVSVGRTINLSHHPPGLLESLSPVFNNPLTFWLSRVESISLSRCKCPFPLFQ